MSAQELITEHLGLWTSATTHAANGRGKNGKVELTGIQKLRELILELAIRGKLVEQNPDDEPASGLLASIAEEKALLAKEKRIKTPKDPPPIANTEIPFALPNGWCWARMEEVSEYIQRGKGPKYADSGEVRVVSQKCVQWSGFDLSPARFINDNSLNAYQNERYIRKYDILWNSTGTGTVGRAAIAKELPFPVVADSHVTVIRSLLINPTHVLNYISSPTVQERIDPEHENSLVSGSTKQVELNSSAVKSLPVPLAPLREQHRIVQKVDELMALCDRLEQQTSDQIEAHETLVDTLLNTLTKSENATELADNWARLAAHFDTFFTTEKSIAKLRQTIRKLAVMGLLTPQDESDEPISLTLKRIAAPPKPSRYKRRSAEVVPGSCGLSINDPNLPTPHGWEWVPLIRVASLESGHTPSRSRSDWWGGDIPWIGITDAREHNGGVINATAQSTNEDGLKNSAARLLPKGTVCFSRTASVGYVVIMGRPMATSQDFVNWVPTEAISSEWLKLVLMAERPEMSRFSKGAVHQTIYYSAWLSMNIALPPVPEQDRIIEKVDELMTLCHELQKRLNQAGKTCCQLAESVVQGALN